MLRDATASETWQAMIALVALALLFWAVGLWVASAPPERVIFTADGMAFVRGGQVDHLRAQHPP